MLGGRDDRIGMRHIGRAEMVELRHFACRERSVVHARIINGYFRLI